MARLKTPREIAEPDTERAHHFALCSWLRYAENHGFEEAWKFNRENKPLRVPKVPSLPELKWMFMVPDNIQFQGSSAERNKRGMMLKLQGLKPGVSDFM